MDSKKGRRKMTEEMKKFMRESKVTFSMKELAVEWIAVKYPDFVLLDTQDDAYEGNWKPIMHCNPDILLTLEEEGRMIVFCGRPNSYDHYYDQVEVTLEEENMVLRIRHYGFGNDYALKSLDRKELAAYHQRVSQS